MKKETSKTAKTKVLNKSLVGRRYSIIENGKRFTGIISKKVGKQYEVKWSDRTITIEDINL